MRRPDTAPVSQEDFRQIQKLLEKIDKDPDYADKMAMMLEERESVAENATCTTNTGNGISGADGGKSSGEQRSTGEEDTCRSTVVNEAESVQSCQKCSEVQNCPEEYRYVEMPLGKYLKTPLEEITQQLSQETLESLKVMRESRESIQDFAIVPLEFLTEKHDLESKAKMNTILQAMLSSLVDESVSTDYVVSVTQEFEDKKLSLWKSFATLQKDNLDLAAYDVYLYLQLEQVEIITDEGDFGGSAPATTSIEYRYVGKEVFFSKITTESKDEGEESQKGKSSFLDIVVHANLHETSSNDFKSFFTIDRNIIADKLRETPLISTSKRDMETVSIAAGHMNLGQLEVKGFIYDRDELQQTGKRFLNPFYTYFFEQALEENLKDCGNFNDSLLDKHSVEKGAFKEIPLDEKRVIRWDNRYVYVLPLSFAGEIVNTAACGLPEDLRKDEFAIVEEEVEEEEEEEIIVAEEQEEEEHQQQQQQQEVNSTITNEAIKSIVPEVIDKIPQTKHHKPLPRARTPPNPNLSDASVSTASPPEVCTDHLAGSSGSSSDDGSSNSISSSGSTSSTDGLPDDKSSPNSVSPNSGALRVGKTSASKLSKVQERADRHRARKLAQRNRRRHSVSTSSPSNSEAGKSMESFGLVKNRASEIDAEIAAENKSLEDTCEKSFFEERSTITRSSKTSEEPAAASTNPTSPKDQALKKVMNRAAQHRARKLKERNSKRERAKSADAADEESSVTTISSNPATSSSSTKSTESTESQHPPTSGNIRRSRSLGSISEPASLSEDPSAVEENSAPTRTRRVSSMLAKLELDAIAEEEDEDDRNDRDSADIMAMAELVRRASAELEEDVQKKIGELAQKQQKVVAKFSAELPSSSSEASSGHSSASSSTSASDDDVAEADADGEHEPTGGAGKMVSDDRTARESEGSKKDESYSAQDSKKDEGSKKDEEEEEEESMLDTVSQGLDSVAESMSETAEAVGESFRRLSSFFGSD